MARLKAFLPRLNSGRAGIVDLNPSTEYVKPLDAGSVKKMFNYNMFMLFPRGYGIVCMLVA